NSSHRPGESQGSVAAELTAPSRRPMYSFDPGMPASRTIPRALGPIPSATRSPAMDTPLSSLPPSSALLELAGRHYLSHARLCSRVRFWRADECAAPLLDRRPAASAPAPDLDCWVGLEPTTPPLNAADDRPISRKVRVDRPRGMRIRGACRRIRQP